MNTEPQWREFCVHILSRKVFVLKLEGSAQTVLGTSRQNEWTTGWCNERREGECFCKARPTGVVHENASNRRANETGYKEGWRTSENRQTDSIRPVQKSEGTLQGTDKGPVQEEATLFWRVLPKANSVGPNSEPAETEQQQKPVDTFPEQEGKTKKIGCKKTWVGKLSYEVEIQSSDALFCSIETWLVQMALYNRDMTCPNGDHRVPMR